MSNSKPLLKRSNTIEPLVKKWWNPFNRRDRNELAYRVKNLTRFRRFGSNLENSGKYTYLGDHYSKERLQKLKTPFDKHVEQLIATANKTGRKIRWLDVGPGLPENFMHYFEQLDPHNKLIDLHTLAPEQILAKHNKKYDKTLQKFETSANLNYTKWKPRLAHHVGAFETYNTSKLGEFDLIFSMMGGFVHNRYPRESLLKAAKMLALGGKAFIQYDLEPVHEREYDMARALNLKLGPNYEVNYWQGVKSFVEIIRRK